MTSRAPVSVVVPTYGRHEVLIETIARLLALEPEPAEILVVDQSDDHPPSVADRLAAWRDEGRIEWVRRARPSIPGAMNDGLRLARESIVLFSDDDVVPVSDWAKRHVEAFADPSVTVVAGQVLQPGESPEALSGTGFRFRSSIEQDVSEVIGANFSVRRAEAIAARGFDERFVQVAYRFEADFCARVTSLGGRIRFVPTASLRHLRAERGGTRAYGNHLRTWLPAHAVGEYYYFLRSRVAGRARGIVRRFSGSIATRHHLRRPWWVPATLCAETVGFVWAVTLWARGPRLLEAQSPAGPSP